MKKIRQKLIKHVIESIVNIYESSLLTLSIDAAQDNFYYEMKRLYLLLFAGASAASPYPSHETEGAIKQFCDFNMYFYENHDTVEFKMYNCRIDYERVMQLIGGLKQELVSGNMSPIYNLNTSVSTRRDFDGSITKECERKVYCQHGTYLCKLDGLGRAQVHDFAKAYESLSDNWKSYRGNQPEDGVAIFDFWDYPWESFTYFCASALATYSIDAEGFLAIKICENCGKMHMPKRSGAKRGIFCSERCQKKYYNIFHNKQIVCIQKQRQYLQTRFNIVKTSHKEQAKIEALIPSIVECKGCQKIMMEKVKSGMCPKLTSSEEVRLLLENYRKRKMTQKDHK